MDWECPACGGALAFEGEACLCGARAVQRSAPLCDICGEACGWTDEDEAALQASLAAEPLTPARAYRQLAARLPCP